MEYVKLSDSEGFTYNAIRTQVKTHGDVITCSPNFKHIDDVIENMDRLQLQESDVILTSYMRSGERASLLVKSTRLKLSVVQATASA